MLERRYLKDLESWMKKGNRKPLMIWGARQVGKTYLVKELFAKRYYKKKTIYIDCRTDDAFCKYCEETVDAKKVINYISLRNNIKIDDSTLIIFDEVQECPQVVTLMKYLFQEFREVPVIATGSMVRIRIKRKKRGVDDEGFLFPIGAINQLTITPLSFDEYLYNRNRKMYETIVEHYQKKIPMEKEIHEMAMEILYEYLLIGGMPEAVNSFIENGNYIESRIVLKEIYDNYLQDMELYQASPESIIRSRAIFRNVYGLLTSKPKKFSPSAIEKDARNRDMRSPLDWLAEAHVIQISKAVRGSVNIPLNGDDEFRVFLGDMGMFAYQSGIDPTSFISKDGRNSLSGVFFENYVANELTARGIELFYWLGKKDAEIEFLLERKGFVIPIDVKKGTGKLNSLKKFKEHNRYDYAIKISSDNYGFDETNRILTIPLYQTFLLADEFAFGKLTGEWKL